MTRAQIRRAAICLEHRRKMLAVRHAPKGQKSRRHKDLIAWMNAQLNEART